MKRTALVLCLPLPFIAILVAACSQSGAHPEPLGDCKIEGCNPFLGVPVRGGSSIVEGGSGDATTPVIDAGPDTGTANDAATD